MRSSRWCGRGGMGVLALASLTSPIAAGAQAGSGRPFPRPSVPWAVAQLVPSPGVDVTAQTAYFTLEWQLTPVLYSFGVRREVFAIRSAVVEPSLRMGGSVEWFINARYTARPTAALEQWGVRTGVRLYIPVIEHGESLAVSLAVSTLTEFDGTTSVAYEAGSYVLFGVFGLRAMFSPRTRDGQTFSLQLAVRYF